MRDCWSASSKAHGAGTAGSCSAAESAAPVVARGPCCRRPMHVSTQLHAYLSLQEKKRLVFEGTVGRDSEALGRLTEDDLRFLFA